jgi:hypothetical protein
MQDFGVFHGVGLKHPSKLVKQANRATESGGADIPVCLGCAQHMYIHSVLHLLRPLSIPGMRQAIAEERCAILIATIVCNIDNRLGSSVAADERSSNALFPYLLGRKFILSGIFQLIQNIDSHPIQKPAG